MKFRDYFNEKKLIIFDGAIGTEIYARGIAKGHCYDELNISMPEIVKDVHNSYMKAGAEILTANTFGANKYILEKYFGIGDKVKEINYYGVRIAKNIAKDKAFVAGSVGPVSRPLDKEDSPSPEEIKEMFKEQIESLLEGGADLIIFETFASITELLNGIEVAKEIDKNLFIIAEMSFAANGNTLFGKNPIEVGLRLNKSEADVIGANCGTGPQNIFDAIRKIGKASGKELSAMPNAGLAQFVQGKFYYPFNPKYFARYGKKYVESGVKVLGGCCGTTPEHIRCLKKEVDSLTPIKRKISKISVSTKEIVGKKEKVWTGVKNILEQKNMISVEIDPPRDTDIEKLIKKIKPYKDYINTINISDSPMAKSRMSPIATGKILKEEFGKEIIIHYTCRDRNILGIQSDLLGASALGLHNILALGGDPPSIGDYPFATGVYDLTSEGLVEMASHLNIGEDILGNAIGKQSSFFIGVAFGIDRKTSVNELERLKKKIDKGAHFIITQPIYDIKPLENIIKEVKKLSLPIIVSVMPFTSFKNAEYLHYEVPGVIVPEKFLKRMEGKKGKEGEKEGAKIAREVIKDLKNIVDGILTIPPLNKIHMLEEIFG
jgi:homocysteine S-methyltransferase